MCATEVWLDCDGVPEFGERIFHFGLNQQDAAKVEVSGGVLGIELDGFLVKPDCFRPAFRFGGNEGLCAIVRRGLRSDRGRQCDREADRDRRRIQT